MQPVIKFGTDGWRGVIADDFTFTNVRVCAQGVAEYILEKGMAARGLIIGYDTRFASEDFAASAAEVISANGIRVLLGPRPAPTPVISYSIVNRKAAGAVIITASHNPAQWNGFKYKPDYAGSASPEVVSRLEYHINRVQNTGAVKVLPIREALRTGLIEYYDPAPAYLEQISRLIDLQPVRQAGLDLAVDSMYGSGIGYFRRLLAGGTTRVLEINAKRNPLFPGIRPEPIAQNLEKLSRIVSKRGMDIGLATDGDADRLGALDEEGSFITPLQVFALLAQYFLQFRGERGGIVKSITTTGMVYRLGEIFSVPVFEMPVGFKYIGPKMLEEDALIGGEESGGYGFRGHIPERDGILSGLFLLDMMVRSGNKPSELLRDLYDLVGPHYYERADFHFPPEQREAITRQLTALKPARIKEFAVAGIDTIDGFRYRMSDGSWLLIRLSGTEPLLRIYAESGSIEQVRNLLKAGRDMAGVEADDRP